MEYTLDMNAAKQADSINSRIDQEGKYLGILTRAEQVTSKKGSSGVDISFKSETGSTADYLTIWTRNSEGKLLPGFNTLMAIMTCLRVKGIKEEIGEVEKYDIDQQKRVRVSVPLFKELMNKPIGLLINMEEYAKNAGGTAWKPSIAGVFDKDEFTASEILNKAQKPEILSKMVQALRNRPLKSSATAPTHAANSAQGSAVDDFASDIPF